MSRHPVGGFGLGGGEAGGWRQEEAAWEEGDMAVVRGIGLVVTPKWKHWEAADVSLPLHTLWGVCQLAA